MKIFAVKLDNGWSYEDYGSMTVLVASDDREQAIELAKIEGKIHDMTRYEFDDIEEIPHLSTDLENEVITYFTS